jgi:hypothetical protein
LAYEPNLAFVPSLVYVPYSLPNFSVNDPILISSSNDDSEYENPPPPAHLPLHESIEHEHALVPWLPRWVRSTQESIGDLIGDPID